MLFAIRQTCYPTGENHGRAGLRQLLGELDLEGVVRQTEALYSQRPFIDNSGSCWLTST